MQYKVRKLAKNLQHFLYPAETLTLKAAAWIEEILRCLIATRLWMQNQVDKFFMIVEIGCILFN